MPPRTLATFQNVQLGQIKKALETNYSSTSKPKKPNPHCTLKQLQHYRKKIQTKTLNRDLVMHLKYHLYRNVPESHSSNHIN